MTSHELAEKLIDMPDMVIVAQDGMDPSDPCEVDLVEESDGNYVNANGHFTSGKHIKITTV